MRCLAVCQTELAIRMLDEILLPSFEMDFIVERKPLAKRLHDSGLNVTAGDPRRTDTYLKADLTPGTCVVVEDDGRHRRSKPPRLPQHGRILQRPRTARQGLAVRLRAYNRGVFRMRRVSFEAPAR